MVRVAGALTAFALLVSSTATPASAQPAGTLEDARWLKPDTGAPSVFPVLLPADGRWLNWRNTFGAPRMRFDPAEGIWKQTGVHQGIDIYADRGTPVVSMTSGVVENVGWTFYSGYRVGIRSTDGSYYFYAHLTGRFPSGIAKGARVGPGTLLGWMGSSGYGPEGTADEFPAHLHLGVQTKGKWIDPDADLRSLYAVAVERLDRFEAERTRLRMAERASSSEGSQTGGPGAELEQLRADSLFPK